MQKSDSRKGQNLCLYIIEIENYPLIRLYAIVCEYMCHKKWLEWIKESHPFLPTYPAVLTNFVNHLYNTLWFAK